MADCDHPGCTGDDNLPNTCNFCDGQFCAEHRLPEKHYCVPEKPAPESSPEFRDTDTEEEQRATGQQSSRSERRPSSRDPPTARSPAVKTKDPEHTNDDDKKPLGRLRGSAKRLKSRLRYGSRRLRYYIWRTVGIGMTLTKYTVAHPDRS